MAALGTITTHQVVKLPILPLGPRNQSCFHAILCYDKGHCVELINMYSYAYICPKKVFYKISYYASKIVGASWPI